MSAYHQSGRGGGATNQQPRQIGGGVSSGAASVPSTGFMDVTEGGNGAAAGGGVPGAIKQHVNTVLWQQGQYLAPDSGINSGVTTQAASLSGRSQHDDMDETVYGGGVGSSGGPGSVQSAPPSTSQQHQQGAGPPQLTAGGVADWETASAGGGARYTQGAYSLEQVEDIDQMGQARTQRLRATMFPEAYDEGLQPLATQGQPPGQPSPQMMQQGAATPGGGPMSGALPPQPLSTQPMGGGGAGGGQQQPGSTMVGRMSGNNEMVHQAFANLMQYQDDSHLATRAIPELTKLLTDEDGVVVRKAAAMVYQLSMKDASRHAILNSQQMQLTLIQAIRPQAHPMDTETCISLSGTLHNLSHMRKGLLTIFNFGGIPGLVGLLSSAVEKVLFYSITTLHNLLLLLEGSKEAVRKAGALDRMVKLLRRDNVKFLAIATDCLQLLAYGHQESKIAILNCGGPAELCRILNTFDYEKLLWTTSRVLKVLSVCRINKQAIVTAGGMHALGRHLAHSSPRLVQNCLWTLRNLSDAATKYEGLEGLLEVLISLLLMNDTKVITCATGILSNLTCNNTRNKQAVCNLGGINALCRTIHHAESLAGSQAERESILEPAVCGLRHLTSRHPGAEQAQACVRLADGIPVLIRQLTHDTRWPLVKAVIGLFRNLALNNENHAQLREAIPHLVGLLQRAFELSKAGGGVMMDGVRLEEVVDGCVGALHVLARDAVNREVIYRYDCVRIFVQLLYWSTQPIQRVAAGVLAELSADRQGVELIKKNHAESRLTSFVSQGTEGIATYAATVVYRMKAYPGGVNLGGPLGGSLEEGGCTGGMMMDSSAGDLVKGEPVACSYETGVGAATGPPTGVANPIFRDNNGGGWSNPPEGADQMGEDMFTSGIFGGGGARGGFGGFDAAGPNSAGPSIDQFLDDELDLAGMLSGAPGSTVPSDVQQRQGQGGGQPDSMGWFDSEL